MSTYKVASLLIVADELPESYESFKTDDSKTINNPIVFRKVSCIHSLQHARKIVELQQFDIWESESYKDAWIYRIKTNFGTMLVAKDYSYAEYFFYDTVKDEKGIELLEPAFRMAIQCRLVRDGFLILHAACVTIDGMAYAFSGYSGVGKSTRALELVRNFSAKWISGDKPIVDPVNRLIYGAPWDGKEKIFNNTCKSLKVILQVNRSKQTLIDELSYWQKYRFIASQIFVPMWDTSLVSNTFDSLKNLIGNVPIHSVFCDRTFESMSEVYNLLQELD